MRQLLKSSSLLAVWVNAIIIIYSQFNIGHWNDSRVIQGDVGGYYSFLPATFIYKDLSFGFDKKINQKYGNAVWVVTMPNGKKLQKYSLGLALMNSPFFMVAHLAAEPLGYEADGYSLPYQMAISLAGGTYALLGFFFLRLLLLRFFREKIATLVLLSTLLTTNLYYYSTSEASMSHAYSFCLFAAFLLYALKWLSQPSKKHTLATGLLAGLILLARPSNALIFIVPALYGVTNRKSLMGHLQLILKKWPLLLAMAFTIFIVILPQLLYWKISTGQWVYFSYIDERFYFNNPHILKGLFSYRKGWLIYTPIMFLSLIGIVLMRKRIPEMVLPVVSFLVINIYVVFSWWCWWYGGSFGCRSMIEAYTLLALPLGVFYEKAFQGNRWKQWLTAVLLLVLTWLNLFQTMQRRRNVIHFDGMTKNAVLDWYSTTYITLGIFWNMLERPDYKSARKGEEEKLNVRIIKSHALVDVDFDDTTTVFSREDAYSKPYSRVLNGENPYTPAIVFQKEDFPVVRQDLQLRVSTYFKQLDPQTELTLVIQFQHKGNTPYVVQRRHFKYRPILENEWNYLFLDATIPAQFTNDHEARTFLYNSDSGDILIDHIKTELLEIDVIEPVYGLFRS